MRNPIIKVSAVALIGLLSLSLTSCRIGSGNQTAQSSPEASASGNETQGSAKCHGERPRRGSDPNARHNSSGRKPIGGYGGFQRNLGELALWKHPLLVR